MSKPTPRPWYFQLDDPDEPTESYLRSKAADDELIAIVYSKADTLLILAAVNAAREINPDNPQAAAAAMPEMFRLLLAVVADAQKICGKRLDLEDWLKRVEAVVDKAMKEAA